MSLGKKSVPAEGSERDEEKGEALTSPKGEAGGCQLRETTSVQTAPGLQPARPGAID